MRASKRIVTTVTAAGAGSSEPEMTVSTSSPDREGDRVLASGADFRALQRNPVLLWAHSRNEIPIGTITHISAEADRLRIRWRWLEGDTFAGRIRNAWINGS